MGEEKLEMVRLKIESYSHRLIRLLPFCQMLQTVSKNLVVRDYRQSGTSKFWKFLSETGFYRERKKVQ